MKIQKKYYVPYRVERKKQRIQDVEISNTSITMLESSDPEFIYYRTKAKEQIQEKLDKKHKGLFQDFVRTIIFEIYTDRKDAEAHAKRINEHVI